jgi:DNA-directed RNA polymerase subunit beta'
MSWVETRRLRHAWAPMPSVNLLRIADQHPSAPAELRGEMRDATSEAKRKKIAKRLKVVEAFRESATSPSG